MTLVEAIAAFEKDFQVITTAGFADDGPMLDMDRAPNGDRYVVITSGGERSVPGASAAWFASEDRAAEEWLRQAWAYAERRGGGDLYWRQEPVHRQMEFFAVDQAGAMRDVVTRQSITINVGFVYSRMVVSKADGETGKGGK